MKPKLLLIEDDADYRSLVLKALSDDFDIVEASTLSEAIASINADEPDAILLDLGLPDSPDTMTLSQIKRHRKSAAVIIISGNDDPELIRRSILETASGYLVKGRDDRHPRQIGVEVLHAIRNNELCRRIDYATRQVLNG